MSSTSSEPHRPINNPKLLRRTPRGFGVLVCPILCLELIAGPRNQRRKGGGAGYRGLRNRDSSQGQEARIGVTSRPPHLWLEPMYLQEAQMPREGTTHPAEVSWVPRSPGLLRDLWSSLQLGTPRTKELKIQSVVFSLHYGREPASLPSLEVPQKHLCKTMQWANVNKVLV